MALLTGLSTPATAALITSAHASLCFTGNGNINWCAMPNSICRESPFSSAFTVLGTRAKSNLSMMQPQLLPACSNPSVSGFSWIQNNHSVQQKISGHERCAGPSKSSFPTTQAEVSSMTDLFEFICSGPLIEKVGLTSDMVGETIDQWILCGSQLCRLFRLNELFLTEPQKIRIFHYYIPVFMWCEKEISKHRSKFKDGDDIPPLVIGFSAPQGCGKTTLVFALDFLFNITGRKTATVSIDDFYLTAEDQAKLRDANPGNALLEFRGNAGTHDLSLSVDTLTAISKLTNEGNKMKIPRYNKSAHSGRGDRADPSTWVEVEGPVTAVLFEGWMLGFKPLPAETVKAVDPQLEVINNNLEAYYDAWHKFIKSWIVIKIGDPSYVFQWRLQVYDFVSRYLPAYKAYLPTLYTEGPKASDPNRSLVVEIDEGRNPILAN